MPRAELTVTGATIAGLTVAAVLVGARPWALPDRVFDGWQVANVPGTLVALLAASTLLCLAAGTVVMLRGTRSRLAEPPALAWLLIVVVAAGALVFNALVLAADASYVAGPAIPVFHWLFTLVPGLLAGALLASRGAAAATAAALATGAVTVPLSPSAGHCSPRATRSRSAPCPHCGPQRSSASGHCCSRSRPPAGGAGHGSGGRLRADVPRWDTSRELTFTTLSA
jgi:hypothetical protein